MTVDATEQREDGLKMTEKVQSELLLERHGI